MYVSPFLRCHLFFLSTNPSCDSSLIQRFSCVSPKPQSPPAITRW
jgi:hypothetical protein